MKGIRNQPGHPGEEIRADKDQLAPFQCLMNDKRQ